MRTTRQQIITVAVHVYYMATHNTITNVKVTTCTYCNIVYYYILYTYYTHNIICINYTSVYIVTTTVLHTTTKCYTQRLVTKWQIVLFAKQQTAEHVTCGQVTSDENLASTFNKRAQFLFGLTAAVAVSYYSCSL